MSSTVITKEFNRYVSNHIPIRLIECRSSGDPRLVGRYMVKDHFQPLIDQLAFDKEHLESYRTQRQRQAAVNELVRGVVKYAVLSHRWSAEEVSLQDFGKEACRLTTGWKKIVEFCHEVARQGIRFAWIDTCCIDKTSSVELDESIRSMFRWYRNSTVCIVHLAQTESLVELPQDEWFSRGWTLQEFLAPRRIQFFGRNWRRLSKVADSADDKQTDPDLLHLACSAAGISTQDLCGFVPSPTSVDRRMSWAARREVTREEDMAYSLMGIFGVSFSIAYGEGADQAFCRLVEAIMMMGGNPSVLNWGGTAAAHHATYCLPASPQNYLRAPDDFDNLDSSDPGCLDMALTSKGLRVPLAIVHLSTLSFDRTQGVVQFAFEAVDIRKVVGPIVLTIQDYELFDRLSQPGTIQKSDLRYTYALGVTSYKTYLKGDTPTIASPIRGFLLEGRACNLSFVTATTTPFVSLPRLASHLHLPPPLSAVSRTERAQGEVCIGSSNTVTEPTSVTFEPNAVTDEVTETSQMLIESLPNLPGSLVPPKRHLQPRNSASPQLLLTSLQGALSQCISHFLPRPIAACGEPIFQSEAQQDAGEETDDIHARTSSNPSGIPLLPHWLLDAIKDLGPLPVAASHSART
ncbi:HET-domain-containing protein [Coniophora puteana RWD-64-598 SS2]|uniref:HET-domain-containing protein n=1 Tax=Coniophora puteana (strain RWD-64-598) TaxID=741705 RepID=A0A5M3MMZ9_CONPW|nr:HET-domain-containing protein [Coniophora puteana RWD-64-598 SS2]EIW80390.1 HET-domain-containing protein [Coniophora puteana RWD-64-598 SS2]